MATAEEIALGTRLQALLVAAGFGGGGGGGPHAASHQNGGADEINVGGLNGVLADPQPPIIGAGANQAVAGNDARLADARTPLAHNHNAAAINAGVLDLARIPISADEFGVTRGDDIRLADSRNPTPHGLVSLSHTVAGLTPGHVLTALTAATFGFAAPTGGAPGLTTVEVNLGATWRRSGSFQIAGLAGLTIGKPVYIQQATGPYTGKGTRLDEAEMDMVLVLAKVIIATTIQCYWNSRYKVRGNFKFNYFVGA